MFDILKKFFTSAMLYFGMLYFGIVLIFLGFGINLYQFQSIEKTNKGYTERNIKVDSILKAFDNTFDKFDSVNKIKMFLIEENNKLIKENNKLLKNNKIK